MIHVIDRLVQDHVNICKMHKCLKTEMQYYSIEGQSPNLGILLDTLDYLKHYPEFFHHPLEDRIYGIMRLRIDDSTLLSILDQIELQHAQMQVLSKRLQMDFFAIANDQVIPIRQLKDDFKQYIELAEEHIACENKYLFPAISVYLTEEDMESIQLDLDSPQDPIFGGQCLAVYESLHEYILEHDHALA